MGAMSGTFATIFSFEKSRKWIIREGLNGDLAERLGGADRERLEEVAWVAHVRAGRILTAAARRLSEASRGPMSETDMTTEGIETDQADPRGLRRPPLRALPRGVRGRRRLQALAREDGHRGGRPPLLPDHDEPPPAAHQRRLRGQSQQGRNVVVGPARLLARARHVGRRRVRQGDRQPRHRGALAPGAGLPRRHAVRRVRGARREGRRSRSPTAAS